MPSERPTGGISDLIVVISDAVRSFVDEDDPVSGLEHLNEALARLDHPPGERLTERTGDRFVDLALAAIIELSKAQDARLEKDDSRSDRHFRNAVGHVLAARDLIQRSITGSGSEGASDHGASVQLSVTEALRVPNEEAITDSLTDLLSRTEEHAFVIFVDAGTGRFCQFIGSRGSPLFLDLPTSSLTSEERTCARRVLAELGYADVEERDGFVVNVGSDVDAGTALALAIFAKVFRSDSDFSLKIEEN